MTILDRIAESTRARVARDRAILPLPVLKKRIRECGEPFVFERVLRRPGLSFICEVKRASPSKGIIAKTYPYMDIAQAYEEGGGGCHFGFDGAGVFYGQ